MPPTRQRCTLPLTQLLEMAADDDQRSLIVEGGGSAPLRVRSRREPWRSCGGHDLLAQVITAASPPAARDVYNCALQRELLKAAAQLGESLGLAADEPSGAFTLLQDCTAPPCCPHELLAFASTHPKATVVADVRSASRGDRSTHAANASALPPNLWSLTPATDAARLRTRRRAARGCGGGCFTVQIAHGRNAPLVRRVARWRRGRWRWWVASALGVAAGGAAGRRRAAHERHGRGGSDGRRAGSDAASGGREHRHTIA